MRPLQRCGRLVGLALAMLAAAVFVLAGSAAASFPGRDGALAVQPVTGSGIVVVNANGSGERVVHATVTVHCGGCGSSSRLISPAWSPDGRVMLVDGVTSVGGEEALIYPDGSCLDCRFPVAGVDGAFTNQPALFTAVSQSSGPHGSALSEYGIDGVETGLPQSGPVSHPAWSSRGELAVVRGRRIWAGTLPRLRPLVPGSMPSWSPDGRQIVFERGGWLRVGRVRGRLFRRLVRGSAPVWSPNGRWIAFFAKHHRLSIVPASGGHVRHVGKMTGTAVDWQPLPATPPIPCLAPSDSRVWATTGTAVVTYHGVQQPYGSYPTGPSSIWALMGCLRADGRERLLETGGDYFGSSTDVSQVVLAGNYAGAVIGGGGKYCGDSGYVELFDLRTGAQVPDRGGEGAACGNVSAVLSIDQLALGSDAVSAVHMTEGPYMGSTVSEEIQASDSTGVHTLDSVSEPSGSPYQLTNLALTGDTLTWEHNGTARSAQLQP